MKDREKRSCWVMGGNTLAIQEAANKVAGLWKVIL